MLFVFVYILCTLNFVHCTLLTIAYCLMPIA